MSVDWDEEWERRTIAETAAVEELSARVQALTATGSDAGKVATATVDAAGALTDLRLARTAAGRTPNDLAATIMAAVRAARAELARKAAAATEEAAGVDAATAAEIRAHYAERFGGEPPAARPSW